MKSHVAYEKEYGNLLWLTNGISEAAVALDYGLRIVIFRCIGMENMLYRQPDDLSDALTTEKGWRIYGGHRFWTSPESDDSYYPDNEPVEYTVDDNSALFTQKTDSWTGFKKQLRLSFCDNGDLKVEHILENRGDRRVKAALWGITTLKAGGVAEIPCKGEAGGYSPNRAVALWSDSALGDERLSFKGDTVIGRHIPRENKLKIGVYTPQGKISAKNLGQRLEITFESHPMENCADNGSNAELFLDKHIMELETLGELKEMEPGETATHTEYWHIAPLKV